MTNIQQTQTQLWKNTITIQVWQQQWVNCGNNNNNSAWKAADAGFTGTKQNYPVRQENLVEAAFVAHVLILLILKLQSDSGTKPSAEKI